MYDNEVCWLQVEEVVLNGPGDLEGPDRYIGNLNLSFAYVEGESLIMGLKVSKYNWQIISLEGFLGYSCSHEVVLNGSCFD